MLVVVVVVVVVVVADISFLPTLNTIAPSVKVFIGVVLMVLPVWDDTAPSSFLANVTRFEWLIVGSMWVVSICRLPLRMLRAPLGTTVAGTAARWGLMEKGDISGFVDLASSAVDTRARVDGNGDGDSVGDSGGDGDVDEGPGEGGPKGVTI
jgi:hypothetical protein